PPQILLDNQGRPAIPQSFSPDGRKLAYHQRGGINNRDVYILPVDAANIDHPKAGPPEGFLTTEASEADPVFSPDGRWLAYMTGTLGAYHVYVRPYPEGAQGGGQARISSAPGRFPMWSQTSKEIFYGANDGRIQTVPYTISGRTRCRLSRGHR